MAGYSRVPTDDPGRRCSGYYAPASAVSTEVFDTNLSYEEVEKNGPIRMGDARYRAELDFDGSGEVDQFEIYFAGILHAAKLGKRVDLTDDVWGCAILTTVSDLPAMVACEMTFFNLLRFSYISLISILNLTLQFALLYWISVYVMSPSMKFSQDIYAIFHQDFFTADGTFSRERFDEFDRAGDLCQFPLSNRGFSYVVLFLWASHCFIEIRSSQRIFSGLVQLPSLPWGISHKLMIHEGLHETDSLHQLQSIDTTLAKIAERRGPMSPGGDINQLTSAVHKLHELVADKYTQEQTSKYLVCLTPLTRVSIFALVLVPRMIIIVALMTMGCIWLTATDSFNELILNAVALEFVVNVDNLLFSMFFPQSLHHEVENLKVALPEPRIDPREGAPAEFEGIPGEKVDIGGYYRSFCYLLMVGGWVFLFQALQPVIPGFGYDLNEACTDYIQAWSSPKYGFNSFSKIASCIMGRDTCFPYGNL